MEVTQEMYAAVDDHFKKISPEALMKDLVENYGLPVGPDSIESAIQLYNRRIEVEEYGAAICGRNLTFNEIELNRRVAREFLLSNKVSKESLVDYILDGGHRDAISYQTH